MEAFYYQVLRYIPRCYCAGARAEKISDLRDALDGPRGDDAGLVHKGVANVTLTNPQGLVYARTPRQVLNILYGAPGVHSGLFFPSGLNGNIS